MRTKTFLFTLLLVLLCTSCDDSVHLPKQKVFFEVRYSNFAWIPYQEGFFIDSIGNAYTYNITNPNINIWNSPDTSGYISRMAMNTNFSKCTEHFTATTMDSLIYYVRKILPASKGKLSKPEMIMVDYGIVTFSAYIYDQRKDSYKRILLYQYGDVSVVNDSPEAKELSKWLARIRSLTVPRFDI